MSQPDMPAPGTVPPLGGAPEPNYIPPGGGAGRTRTWIVVVLVAIAVVIAAVTIVLVVADDTGIHDGSGTATFTWAPVSDGSSATPSPQTFSGDIDGLAVTGTSTLILPESALAGGHFPKGPVPFFRYKGTLAGSPFDITLSYHFPAGFNPADPATAETGGGLYLTVAGTYGSSTVQGKVSQPGGSGSTHPVTFTGTVGHWKVSGTIPEPTGTSSKQTATAHFVVSG